jgi:rod shape-determining protein MreB and related proteins
MKLGLDLGSSTLRVADEKQGVFLREACVIGDGLAGGPNFVVGATAEKMIGRTPEHLHAVCPMGRGVVSAPLATGEFLKELLPKAVGWRWKWRPEVVAAVPARITEPQKESLVKALRFAGASHVSLMAKPVAAALGASPDTGTKQSTMVVDVGAQTTEVAALAPGIVVCEAIPLGGRQFDEAILCHLRNDHGLEVSNETAESLKKELGSAHPVRDEKKVKIFGREMDSSLPHTVEVNGKEIRECLAHPLNQIVALVKQTLDKTPPGLSSDILEHGLVLTGNGALLKGLDEFLAEACGLKVRVADNPGDCAVLGLLRSKHNFQEEQQKEEN